MQCIFGPYQVTSILPKIGESFIDNNKNRQIVVFGNCSSTILPCSEAILLHRIQDCPNGCDISWYECPDKRREYTLLITPCGVTITSFIDGLISNNCDATKFGSSFYCFGKIYTALKTFESTNKSIVSFEFDGNSFTVQGSSSECSELFDCSECQETQEISLFEEAPTPPPLAIPPLDSSNTEIIENTTQTIEIENRPKYAWNATTKNVSQNVFCEDEKSLKTLLPCLSNDNPSITTLPSGHTIIAYENRKEDGLTKISLAILSSSVKQNIRYYRKLAKGVLLNNLVESQGTATFEIYDEMYIATNVDNKPSSQEQIGFLTGPLSGSLFLINKITRETEGERVKITVNFQVSRNVVFPDKNNIHNIEWFITNNQGSKDLPPPNNSSVITILDLPVHFDLQGIEVPVSHPSIAVANNNLMTSEEQNIYVVYQAFENNQWRVYLREIVLSSSGNKPPVYLSPYLFDDNQRVIEVPEVSAIASVEEEVTVIPFIFDDNFTFGTASNLGYSINHNPNWVYIPTPAWLVSGTLVLRDSVGLYYCNQKLGDPNDRDGVFIPPDADGCTDDDPDNPTNELPPCIVVFSGATELDENDRGNCLAIGNIRNLVTPWVYHGTSHAQSFVLNTNPSRNKATEKGYLDLEMKLSFALTNVGVRIVAAPDITPYPEIWFFIGRSQIEESQSVTFGDGWRIQILRGRNDILASYGTRQRSDRTLKEKEDSCSNDGITEGPVCASGNNQDCFIIRLYNGRTYDNTPVLSTEEGFSPSTGQQFDTPVRTAWHCITEGVGDVGFDYDVAVWNEITVQTRVRGLHRIFKVSLSARNSSLAAVVLAEFREWDVSVNPADLVANIAELKLGEFHGFGVATTSNLDQVLFDHVSLQPLELLPLPLIFYEDDIFVDDVNSGHGVVTKLNDEPSGNKYLLNFSNEPTSQTFSGGSDGGGWEYSKFSICATVDAFGGVAGASLGDAFVGNDLFYKRPHAIGNILRLEYLPGCGLPSQWPINSDIGGNWTYTAIRVETADIRVSPKIPIHDNISFIISASPYRGARSNSSSWPHITFVMKLKTVDEEWYKGYRIRISRFNARKNYAPMYLENGSIRPAILNGEKFWRIQYFEGHDGTNTISQGLTSDPVHSEIWLRINGTTDPPENPGYTDLSQKTPFGIPFDWDEVNLETDNWSYFKVDLREIGSEIEFKVYFYKEDASNADSSIRTGIDNPDSIPFQLNHMCTFRVPSIVDRRSGTYYGFAFHSGNRVDEEFGDGFVLGNFSGDDYYAAGQINYIRLSTIDQDGGSPPSTGSCCRAIGGPCEDDVLSNDCLSPNIFYPNTSCDEINCTLAFPTGSSCNSSGFCYESTEAESIIQGYEQWQLGVSCSSKDCLATVTGSCCRPTEECIEDLLFNECKTYFGMSPPSSIKWRPGIHCPSIGPSCQSLATGACCLSSGCYITTQDDCISQSGTWAGLHTDCVSNPCIGACCDGTSCSQTDQATCEADEFTFLGYGVSCAPNPCLIYTIGACCFENGECFETIESACTNGHWRSGEGCDTCYSTIVTGACCDPMTGMCEDNVLEVDCLESGRLYQGNVSECSLSTCEQPVGACCIGTECSNHFTQSDCENSGGLYLGNFTNCISNLCSDNIYLHTTSVTYKPEDVWKIKINDNDYITRVLYHMREEISSATNLTNNIDFMFLIDYSGSMATATELINQSISTLQETLMHMGLNVRFGFVAFGRGVTTPVPAIKITCEDSTIFDGLQISGTCVNSDHLEGSAESGFTRSTSYLQRSLSCWGTKSGKTSPWAAINYAVENSHFSWREDASKFMFFLSDTNNESEFSFCETVDNNKQNAKQNLIDNNIVFIPVIDSKYTAVYSDIARDSGWAREIFSVESESYDSIFNTIAEEIDLLLRISHATIIERASAGASPDFLKKAEVIITYNGDLTDLWTFNKSDFEFKTEHVPFPGNDTKGLNNFPFELYYEHIYGIEPVHIQGIPQNWVSFNREGPLVFDYLNIGSRSSSQNSPILISTNSTRPKVFINNRNQVIVAYETYVSGISQIEIKGTGDFHQDSIIGPKASRIQRFFVPEDFAYNHTISLNTEGLNQLCDFIIDNNDITHITWQSNRDGNWEIYYANSYNLFKPIRLTKSDSRSSYPTISVDNNGSIFVVYHDNRFGPFEIMLASKTEDRVIPLIEQDAYLASLRNQYSHYTNTLPLFLDNPKETINTTGQFWAVKLSSGSGNNSKSEIYKINEATGAPSDSQILVQFLEAYLEEPGGVLIEFSSKFLYGITVASGIMFELATINDDGTLTFNTKILGRYDLQSSGTEYSNPKIKDIAIDQFDRIWVLISEERNENETITYKLRIDCIDSKIPLTLFSGTAIDGKSSPDGTLSINTKNKFYITNGTKLSISLYPILSPPPDPGGIGTAIFNFGEELSSIQTYISTTSDESDNLFGVTETNDLYKIDVLTLIETFQTSLTTSSDADIAVGETLGISYQASKQEIPLETGETFQIRIDFYDNIGLEGNPKITIDSTNNLEAFINETSLLEDPYSELIKANGISVIYNEVEIIFFDAANYVPGFSLLSQPYSFETNQTYFPRVYLIDSFGNSRETGISQLTSFSCTKCSKFGNNNFNSNSCSYSFVVQNNDNFDKFLNFQIDFYADSGKTHLIRRFDTSINDDLQYMEIDNHPISELWTENGIEIESNSSYFIQVYPVLDPNAGFFCGVKYTVQVNQCIGDNCSDFSIVTPNNWISLLINTSDTQLGIDKHIDSQIGNEKILGLSMTLINDNIGIAWKSEDNNLFYSQFNGSEWFTDAVLVTGDIQYCYLSSIQNKPSIVYVRFDGSLYITDILVFENNHWNSVGSDFRYESDLPISPRFMTEYLSSPIVVESSLEESGQPTFTTPTKSATWDTDVVCKSAGILVGSCTISVSTINGKPSVAYIAQNVAKYGEWDTDFETFNNLQDISTGSIYLGIIGLTEVQEQPAVAYISREGSLGKLRYKRFNGSSWQEVDTNTGIKDFNKNIAMTVINGWPVIVYTIKKLEKSELRITVFNGTYFRDEIIDSNIDCSDPIVDVIEFQNESAVTISSNPFKIYLYKQQSASLSTEINPIFVCDCSSKIFTNRLANLNEISRWESSGFGFSDTRVTDSPKNSLKPIIKIRNKNTAIIAWEDYNPTDNCSDPPCIRAATFKHENQDKLISSGTNSWFDYDFGVSGQNLSIVLDFYDRINMIYEKPKKPNSSGFYGRGLSIDELPTNTLYSKICDLINIEPEETVITPECDISNLKANVISFDPFISSKIVRKIKVRNDFVEYYTYNSSGILTPIVSTCNIVLEIHGTPEIVAIRLRNENSSNFNEWCAWSPLLSDFVLEKKHKISNKSGIKEICIQAITYSGITSEFCLPIIADYEKIVFDTKFYKDFPDSTNFIITDGTGNFPKELDSKLIHLPLLDGISIAGLIPTKTENLPSSIKILVEIIPNKIFDQNTLSFDVLQQGSDDTFGLIAQKGKNNDGRVVYRGTFTIEKEDNIFNLDGLARIHPSFPDACEDTNIGTSSNLLQYNKDKFNTIGEHQLIEENELDSLSQYRQTVSGRIGVTLDIKSTEDPYFIFGDPEYSLKKSDGQRLGVPFKSIIGEISSENGSSNCQPPQNGCPEGTTFNSQTCICQEDSTFPPGG